MSPDHLKCEFKTINVMTANGCLRILEMCDYDKGGRATNVKNIEWESGPEMTEKATIRGKGTVVVCWGVREIFTKIIPFYNQQEMTSLVRDDLKKLQPWLKSGKMITFFPEKNHRNIVVVNPYEEDQFFLSHSAILLRTLGLAALQEPGIFIEKCENSGNRDYFSILSPDANVRLAVLGRYLFPAELKEIFYDTQ